MTTATDPADLVTSHRRGIRRRGRLPSRPTLVASLVDREAFACVCGRPADGVRFLGGPALDDPEAWSPVCRSCAPELLRLRREGVDEVAEFYGPVLGARMNGQRDGLARTPARLLADYAKTYRTTPEALAEMVQAAGRKLAVEDFRRNVEKTAEVLCPWCDAPVSQNGGRGRIRWFHDGRDDEPRCRQARDVLARREARARARIGLSTALPGRVALGDVVRYAETLAEYRLGELANDVRPEGYEGGLPIQTAGFRVFDPTDDAEVDPGLGADAV